MSLDKKICPSCNSKDVEETKEHNLLNLAIGISTFTALGAATDNLALIGLGVVFYVADIPLGPDKGYKCNSCYESWR
jgi:hypothetical protein